jgi:hypothetical protein
MLETKSSKATRSVCCLPLLLETKSSRATWSLGRLLLLLKSQCSRTPRGEGWVLLRLKTKTSRTPRGKFHLLPLSKTFICILLQKQPELPPSTDRAPPTQQPVYETAKDSSSSGFFVSGQKVQNINMNTCR